MAPSCDDVGDGRLELDPGAEPQIHPAAAWDGEALQLVWNGPRDPDSGNFQVLRRRVYCDGTMDDAQVVDGDATTNNVDPAVAVSGDRVLAAWQADSGASPYNLSIGVAPLPLTGDPDRPWAPLEMQRADGPYEGNAWMPRLAPEPGGFVLAGSRGIDSIGRFQSFVQTLELDGAPWGASEDVNLEFEVSQVEPALGLRADRTRVVAWEERPDEGDNRVVWRELGPDGFGPMGDAAGLATQEDFGVLEKVALAVEPTEREAVVFVAHGGADIDVTLEVVDRGDGTPGPTARLGEVGETDHTPAVVLGPDGGVVIWHQVVSGLSNELLVQPFRLEGDPVEEIVLGEVVTVVDEAVAPYPPSITPVGDGLWFLAWSEGQSPALRLAGRFLRIE